MAALPVLAMVMLLTRPVFHALIELVILQVPAGPVVGAVVGGAVGALVGGVVGVVVGGVVGVVVGVLLPAALMIALMMPCWVTVLELRLNRPKPYWPLTPLSQYAVAAPYFLAVDTRAFAKFVRYVLFAELKDVLSIEPYSPTNTGYPRT